MRVGLAERYMFGNVVGDQFFSAVQCRPEVQDLTCLPNMYAENVNSTGTKATGLEVQVQSENYDQSGCFDLDIPLQVTAA